jgi:hypothetical protein
MAKKFSVTSGKSGQIRVNPGRKIIFFSSQVGWFELHPPSSDFRLHDVSTRQDGATRSPKSEIWIKANQSGSKCVDDLSGEMRNRVEQRFDLF